MIEVCKVDINMENISYLTLSRTLKLLKMTYSPGSCIVCDETKGLKSMDHFIDSGELISASKMLKVCYNIEICISKTEDGVTEMCETCCNSLKGAYYFRQKVVAVDENLKLTHHKNDNDKMMQMLLKRCDSDYQRNETLDKILLKKKVKHEILDQLKTSEETSYNNCVIKRMISTKPPKHFLKKSKKKNKVKKIKQKSFTAIIDNIDIADRINDAVLMNDHCDFDFDRDLLSHEESSNDSDDTKELTGLVKEKQTAKKDIFLIPALDPSSTSCPICEMVPNSRQSLIRHYYDTHFPSFLCHLCGYGTTLRDSFTSHMKTHKGVIYSCSSCPKTFFSPISKYHHEKAIHRKIPLFSCTMCEATFSHSVTRRKHMSEKHAVPCQTHPCADCGKVFFSGHRLSVHIKRSHLQHRPFCCTVCGYSFFQNCDLRDHMTKHTGAKDFHCDQCGKFFSRRACLTEHLKIHLNIRNFMCHLCDKSFVQKVSLKGHMRTHEKNNKGEN